jgi:peptide/nickel transport system substrate-binding protein
VFSCLSRLDDTGQPLPDLAESWQISSDGLTYTFKLRPGLVWHDGQAFDADDVLFTYRLLESPALRSPPGLALALAGATVTKADQHTVRIQLSQPYAPLLAYLSLGILPEHLLAQTHPSALFDSDFNRRPIGTGSYKLEELDSEHALLVANSAYHHGQPYLERLELRFFRDDNALLAAVRSESIDAAFFETGLSANDYLYLESRKDLRLASLSSGEVTFLYFNLEDALFQDRRLRQALLHAIDRDAMLEEAPFVQASKADSPLPKGTWATAPSLSRYASDPNLAGLLLDEAGWRRGASGIRSNGRQQLAFTIATNNDPVRLAMAEAIAQKWQAVGVDARVEGGGTTTLVRDILEPRDFEVALFAYRADVDPDPYLAWHSSEAGFGGRNISALEDPRIDKMLEEARQSPNQARRVDLYREFQELFAQEVPAIPLFSSESLYVQEESIQGVRAGYLDNPGARFWQVQDWHRER